MLTLALAYTACIGKPPYKPVTWTSKYHCFEAECSSPWVQINPSIDTKDKMLFGVIDESNGTSYIVKIVNDVSTDQLSNEQYYQAIIDLMLAANDENRLLEENDSEFHGKTFHRQVFLMYTEQWGLLKQYAQTLRTGEKVYSVQMSFPVEERCAETTTLPQQLIDLDQKVKIDDK